MNLRCLFLFLWFCQLTILILLYSGFNCFFLLNFWFIVVISLKVSRVKLIKDSGNSTSEVFLTFQMESVKVYILSIENHPPFFHLLILRKSRHALSFPRNMTKSGQFGSISNHIFYRTTVLGNSIGVFIGLLVSISIVTFSPAFRFFQLTSL